MLATIVRYGDQIDSSLNTSKLAIYRRVRGHFLFSLKFVDAQQANIGYGSTVSVSDNGEYITVGAQV